MCQYIGPDIIETNILASPFLYIDKEIAY
jgi:hypothetical protein